MSSVIQAGLKGILEGLRLAEGSANRISQGFRADSDAEPLDSMIQLKSAERQVKASAKVVHAGDELEKAVIDLLA